MNIVFLCTGNSCRSQMAEAFAAELFPVGTRVYSAGLEKHGLNTSMLEVMRELGFSMETHSSKLVSELPPVSFDLAVTVCDHAAQRCPKIAAKNHLHLSFPDPPELTRGMEKEEEILALYRTIRDDIRRAVESLAQNYKA